MAAGDSATSISNMALLFIGEDLIVNVSPPDNTKRAVLCSQFYDPVRRAVLEAAPWDCAKREAQLAASGTNPLFNYAKSYPLPADFIRMWEWPQEGRPVWEIANNPTVGRCIMSSVTPGPLPITYVFDLQDPTMMDPTFVLCLAYGLAGALALPLARDGGLRAQMMRARDELIAAARVAASQQGFPPQSDAEAAGIPARIVAGNQGG